MKNQIDFLKIKNGEWGAINFNNMIPVPIGSLTKVEIKLSPSDTKADIDYKNLLSNQLSWCNSNKDTILKQASKLYTMITQGKAWGNLTGRCCSFLLDEQQCLIYENLIYPSDGYQSKACLELSKLDFSSLPSHE